MDRPKVQLTYQPTEEMLKALKERLMTVELEQQTLAKMYQSAICTYWRTRIILEIKRFPFLYIHLDNEYREAIYSGVDTLICGRPIVQFHLKLQSQKWSKTVNWIELPNKLNADIKWLLAKGGA